MFTTTRKLLAAAAWQLTAEAKEKNHKSEDEKKEQYDMQK
jgi:hypothetical protein